MYKVKSKFVFIPNLGNLRRGDILKQEDAERIEHLSVLIREGVVELASLKKEKKEKKEKTSEVEATPEPEQAPEEKLAPNEFSAGTSTGEEEI